LSFILACPQVLGVRISTKLISLFPKQYHGWDIFSHQKNVQGGVLQANAELSWVEKQGSE
jgi:hypothetical protein